MMIGANGCDSGSMSCWEADPASGDVTTMPYYQARAVAHRPRRQTPPSPPKQPDTRRRRQTGAVTRPKDRVVQAPADLHAAAAHAALIVFRCPRDHPLSIAPALGQGTRRPVLPSGAPRTHARPDRAIRGTRPLGVSCTDWP